MQPHSIEYFSIVFAFLSWRSRSQEWARLCECDTFYGHFSEVAAECDNVMMTDGDNSSTNRRAHKTQNAIVLQFSLDYYYYYYLCWAVCDAVWCAHLLIKFIILYSSSHYFAVPSRFASHSSRSQSKQWMNVMEFKCLHMPSVIRIHWLWLLLERHTHAHMFSGW